MSMKYAFFLCIYYRRFIKDVSPISKCLHTLTEKGTGFKWTSDFQSAFDILKFRPTNAPILGHPDFNHQFIFDTDAGNESIGAGLSKNINGTETVLAYAILSAYVNDHHSDWDEHLSYVMMV